MSAIRIERKPAPIDESDRASTATPPEWKWDTLPVLKEVIEADAPSADAPPTEEATE